MPRFVYLLPAALGLAALVIGSILHYPQWALWLALAVGCLATLLWCALAVGSQHWHSRDWEDFREDSMFRKGDDRGA